MSSKSKKLRYEDLLHSVKLKIDEEFGGVSEFINSPIFLNSREELGITESSLYSYLSKVSEGKEGVRSERVILGLWKVLFPDKKLERKEIKIVDVWYECY